MWVFAKGCGLNSNGVAVYSYNTIVDLDMQTILIIW